MTNPGVQETKTRSYVSNLVAHRNEVRTSANKGRMYTYMLARTDAQEDLCKIIHAYMPTQNTRLRDDRLLRYENGDIGLTIDCTLEEATPMIEAMVTLFLKQNPDAILGLYANDFDPSGITHYSQFAQENHAEVEKHLNKTYAPMMQVTSDWHSNDKNKVEGIGELVRSGRTPNTAKDKYDRKTA